MKKIFIILLACWFNECFPQDKIDTLKQRKILMIGDNTYEINTDSIISAYADSINRIDNTERFPSFLFDECFEDNLPLFKGFHSPEDYRWEIINRVTNKEAIELILESKDNRLVKKCWKIINRTFKKVKNKYLNYSVYDLLNQKYDLMK